MKRLFVSLILILCAQLAVVGNAVSDTSGCIECHVAQHAECFDCHNDANTKEIFIAGVPIVGIDVGGHHDTIYADVGYCDYCHKDPRDQKLNLTGWDIDGPGPGDNGEQSGLDVPTQLACIECHISFENGNMIVNRLTRDNYVSYADEQYEKEAVHTIENPDLAALRQINNYGICFSCHDGIRADAVTIWHARPDKFHSSWVYGESDDRRCTGSAGNDSDPNPPTPLSWSKYAAGRSSGSIGSFNLFRDPGFGYIPHPSWADPCTDRDTYSTPGTASSFTRIPIPAVPGNANTSGSVPVFASICPMVVVNGEGVENCPLEPPVLIDEADEQCTTCSVTLEWNAVNAPLIAEVGYLVEVDNNSDFSSPNYTSDPDNWITSTSFSVTMATDTTYYWRVTARDNINTTDESPASTKDSFRLYQLLPLATPTLSWPPNGYEMEDWRDPHVGWDYGNVYQPNPLRWNAVSGANQYYCRVWRGGTIVKNSGWISSFSYFTGDLPDDNTYTWRVLARNTTTGQYSAWSAPRTWFDNWIE